MTRIDRERIGTYYDHLVEKHGYSVRARDALREASLTVRYEALSDALDLAGKRVLEVGCGFGDLGVFLKERYGSLHYVGTDISRRMIDTGREVHPDLDLRHEDVLDWPTSDRFDIVLAQGVFYLLGDDAEVKMRRLIDAMFGLATEAVAFCTLSAWGDQHEDGEFYANPLRTLDHCRTLTHRVALRHDYLPNDFTICLYR